MDDSRYVLRHFVCALSIDEAISASDAPPIKQRVNGYDAFRASLQPELGEFGEFFGFTQSSVDGDYASGQAILMQRPGRTDRKSDVEGKGQQARYKLGGRGTIKKKKEQT